MAIPNPFLSFRLDTLQVYLLLEFALRFEKRLMVLHHWHYFIRMDIFSDETCFSKTVLIYIQSITLLTFLDVVPIKFLFCSAYLFFFFYQAFSLIKLIAVQLQLRQYFSTSSLLINLIFLLLSLKSSDCPYLVSEFLPISCC